MSEENIELDIGDLLNLEEIDEVILKDVDILANDISFLIPEEGGGGVPAKMLAARILQAISPFLQQ